MHIKTVRLPKRSNIPDPGGSNGTKNTHSNCFFSPLVVHYVIHSSFFFWSGLSKTIVETWRCDLCYFLFSNLWSHEQGQHVWEMCILHHELTFFLLLLRRSKTDIAEQLGAHISSKKLFLLCKYWTVGKAILQAIIKKKKKNRNHWIFRFPFWTSHFNFCFVYYYTVLLVFHYRCTLSLEMCICL